MRPLYLNLVTDSDVPTATDGTVVAVASPTYCSMYCFVDFDADVAAMVCFEESRDSPWDARLGNSIELEAVVQTWSREKQEVKRVFRQKT